MIVPELVSPVNPLKTPAVVTVKALDVTANVPVTLPILVLAAPDVLMLVVPVIEAPPLVTLSAPLRVSPPKVGDEPDAISWTVLMVPEPLSVKLVALKVAIPFVEASALALLIVIVPELPELLAKLKAPVCESKETTPPPEQLASVCKHTVSAALPSAGMVSERLFAWTADCSDVVNPSFVPSRNLSTPTFAVLPTVIPPTP